MWLTMCIDRRDAEGVAVSLFLLQAFALGAAWCSFDGSCLMFCFEPFFHAKSACAVPRRRGARLQPTGGAGAGPRAHDPPGKGLPTYVCCPSAVSAHTCGVSGPSSPMARGAEHPSRSHNQSVWACESRTAVCVCSRVCMCVFGTQDDDTLKPEDCSWAPALLRQFDARPALGMVSWHPCTYKSKLLLLLFMYILLYYYYHSNKVIVKAKLSVAKLDARPALGMVSCSISTVHGNTQCVRSCALRLGPEVV
jgi:hypothetical protein